MRFARLGFSLCLILLQSIIGSITHRQPWPRQTALAETTELRFGSTVGPPPYWSASHDNPDGATGSSLW